MRPLFFLALFISSVPLSAFGQIPQPDSLFVLAAKNQVVRQYEQAFARQEHVYDGNEYIAHDHRIKIHPFFPTDTLLAGTIMYNDVRYHDVPMLYDIVRDQVAVQPPEGGYRIQLRPDKIRAFSLGNHQFARIAADTTAGVATGFYEILYNGRDQVLVRRIKTVHEDISSGTYKADYLTADRFYVRKKGVLHEVKTKRSLLTLFPEQAKALKKYLRTNHLKFNDEQREMAITGVAKQYDALTQ